MKKCSSVILLACLGAFSLFAADQPTPASVTVAPPSSGSKKAITPVPKTDEKFTKRHQLLLERAKNGPYDLLFLGDSITQHWEEKGLVAWNANYQKYKAANFGIGGDGTQNVLWRIENGELDGLQPKVVVLMIGTNNSGGSTGAEIAEANALIIKKVQEKIPNVKVLLLGIFPRGPRQAKDGSMDDGVKRMEAINSANVELAKLENGKTIRFLNINSKFLDANGKIPDDLMPDQLHPGPKGYEIWATAMQPLLDEMMTK